MTRALLPRAPMAGFTHALALALALTACDRPAEYDAPLDPSPPYALDHHIAWLLHGPPALFTLDPATLTTTRTPLPAPPLLAFVTPDKTALLILDETPAAHYIPFDATGPGTPIHLPLTTRYGAATFAPDTRRLILHAGDTNTGAALINPNQIALIDLDTHTVTERTLRSFGDRPQAIIISPLAPIAGSTRQLTWALSDRYIALIDLQAPTAREVIVHLTLAADTRTIAPRQLILADTEDGPTAFVRADAADDIFALTFPTDTPPETIPRPILNQLPAGTRPTDLAAIPLPTGTRIITIEPTLPGLSLIDPATADRITIPTDLPIARILPFTAPRPPDDPAPQDDPAPEPTPGHFALLWQPGSPGVIFADLDHLADRRGRALTPLVLADNILTLHPIPHRRMAIATIGPQQIVIIDFDARTATPLTLAAPLATLLIDPDGTRIYLHSPPDIIALEVDTLTATTAPAHPQADQLLHIPAAHRLVLAHTYAPLGRVTILPETPTEEAPIHRAPLFLEGVFTR